MTESAGSAASVHVEKRSSGRVLVEEKREMVLGWTVVENMSRSTGSQKDTFCDVALEEKKPILPQFSINIGK